MTEDIILNLGTEALKTGAIIGAPILLTTLVVGMGVSIFQAVTQINEATLTFIPKMILVGVVIVLAGPWMVDIMTSYTENLYENVATLVRE
jgi:flagellar biosynthetic protein FliQ